MKKFFQNKTVKFVLKTGVSVGFLTYVIFKVNWVEVFRNILSISPWLVILYMVVLVIGMVISSYKWKFLAEYKGFKLSLFDYFKFYLAGTFINNFMPSFIGGDTYKAYQIGKEGKRYAEAGSTVMMDRITGLVGAIFVSLIFSVLNIRNVLKSDTLIVVNILVLLSFSSDVIIAAMKKSEFWKGLARRFLPKKILHLIREIYNYGDNKGLMKRAIWWAMIYDIVGIAMVNYILFWALNVHISPLNYLSAIFLTSIVASIPISINNIGIKEWSYIAFFGAFGADPSAVITISILSRFLQMFVSLFALPVYLKDKLPKGGKIFKFNRSEDYPET